MPDAPSATPLRSFGETVTASERDVYKNGNAGERRGSMNRRAILYCDCVNANVIPEDRRRAVRAALEAGSDHVVVVRDLCRLAAEKDACLREVVSAPEVVVIACYPRAVRSLFHAGGVELDPARATFLNMRTHTADDILDALGMARQSDQAPAEAAAADVGWRPWFPVIDYDRCVHCGQCLNFCLFGVYERDDSNRVVVANPARCKDNCPACARMCPHVAIVFPKIAEETPISGSDDDPASAPESVKLSQEELFGGDLRTKLRKRARTRSLLKESSNHAVESSSRVRRVDTQEDATEADRASAD